MQKQIIRRKKIDTHFNGNLHPLLQRIYNMRNIQGEKELERGLEHLLPFQKLLNIDNAVAIIFAAIENKENILIIGDFDADGATSSALAVRVLKSFGVEKVDYLVPNRFAFGYGLTPELIAFAKEKQPSLIITVDNGIANHEGVLAAKSLGMKVVITDHHLAGDTLPLADAIINPNQPGDEFPSKNIAGVGVIFYVMLALRRHLKTIDWFQQRSLPEPNMASFLDLVALGTVADVVSLDHNNRILVYQGLRRIRAGLCCPGIAALVEVANKSLTQLSASDLGFSVGPRLNAAGRLEDMSLGIECLLSGNICDAKVIALRLNQLNEERKVIEHEMQTQALDALYKLKTNYQESGICLFDENWHQGVIGILASRMKDRFHRPVIAFALSNENELKGSARSIPGIHIRDVLAYIHAQKPHLIAKFGGHAMAAGLTLMRNAFEEFTKTFNEVILEQIKKVDLMNAFWSDGELEEAELTLEIAEILKEGGPWGQNFPEPLFDGKFKLLDQRLVGSKHLKMMLEKNLKMIPAIAFNVDLNMWPNYRCETINIAYRLDINEFQGRRNIQLIVEHIEPI